MLAAFESILFIVAIIAILFVISLIYEWFKRKTNVTRIGHEYFLRKLLKDGDYVSIKGKVMAFETFTKDKEVVFDNPHGLGYCIYPLRALSQCEFIIGKYGVKWALSEKWAKVAKDKITENRLI